MAVSTGAAILGAGALGAAASLAGRPKAQPPNTSGVAALPSWLQNAIQQGTTGARDIYGQGPQSFFPGQTYADFDPNQIAGLQAQLGAAGQQQQLLGAINPAFGNALNAGSIYSDPSVMAGLNTIESRANQNFLQNILPGLRRGATGAGQEFGTRGELAAGVAAGDLTRDIGDAQSTFLANQLASARGLQSSAMSNAPNLLQAQGIPGALQFGVGSTYQGQNQLGIDEAMQRFAFGQNAPGMSLDQYISRLGSLGGTGGGSAINYPSPQPATNPLAGALGGAMLGSQIAPYFTNAPSTGGYVNPSPFGSGPYQYDPFRY